MASRCFHVLALLSAMLPVSAAALTTFDDPVEYVPTDPPRSLFGTVVELTWEPAPGLHGRCSGSLLESGNHVLTAAHCVTDANGARDVSEMTVNFGNGATVAATKFDVHEEWTGDPHTSGADLAVITLPGPAPAGTRGFPVATFDLGPPPTSVLLAGYGKGGQGGVDADHPAGVLRMGVNHYDSLPAGLGLPAYVDAFYAFDFDDYTESSNLLGEPGWVTIPASPPYQSIIELDLDFDGDSVHGEVMLAEGDSGGPTIAEIFIVGVHSWGTGATGFDAPVLLGEGEFEAGHGAIAGDVVVANYADWIQSIVVPEPDRAALVAASFAGLAAVRGRRRVTTPR